LELITESDTSHTILHTENVIVDRVDTVELVATIGGLEHKLRVIDAREVESTGGLHLAHSEAERPREGGEILENVVGKIGTMHLWDDRVVVDVGGIFEEGNTVNVERRLFESIRIIPVGTSGSVTGHEVERLDGVVEVAEINFGIGVRGGLILCLGDEYFMVVISEVLALLGIKVHIVTPDLRSRSHYWAISVTALDANLNIVVLERHEG
jgi:hypothetical protein